MAEPDRPWWLSLQDWQRLTDEERAAWADLEALDRPPVLEDLAALGIHSPLTGRQLSPA